MQRVPRPISKADSHIPIEKCTIGYLDISYMGLSHEVVGFENQEELLFILIFTLSICAIGYLTSCKLAIILLELEPFCKGLLRQIMISQILYNTSSFSDIFSSLKVEMEGVETRFY